MSDIDKALNAMTEVELTSVEQELDKKAAELTAEYHFTQGVLMAREAVDQLSKTGKVTDTLALFMKTAGMEISAPTAETKTAADELADQYFELGRKMASGYVAGLKGNEKTSKDDKPWMSPEGSNKETYPISRALTSPAVGAGLGGLSYAALGARMGGAKGALIAAPVGAAIGAGATALVRSLHARARAGRQAQETGGDKDTHPISRAFDFMNPISRIIHERARVGRKHVGSESEGEKRLESEATSRKTAGMLTSIGRGIGNGLMGLGAKGTGKAFGQGALRSVGSFALKNKAVTGGAALAGGAAGMFAMGRASKDE